MFRLILIAVVMIVSFWIPSTNPLEDTVPRFEAAPCPVEFATPIEVECGYLIVPVEHAKPDGPTIRLAVAKFPAYSRTPRAEPIVYLIGGPGAHALDAFVQGLGPTMRRLVVSHDLIVIDQRGIGYSEPALTCDMALEADDYSTACYEYWVDQGVNIGAFNTVESAADIAALAPALGYEKLKLFGVSYGTTLAFTVMRHSPDLVHSAYLTGVTPPQVDLMASFGASMEQALNRLFAACAADEACNTAYPDLRQVFYDMVQTYNDTPLEITLGDTIGTISGDYLLQRLDPLMYSPYEMAMVPFLLWAVHTQNVAVLATLQEGNQGKTQPTMTEGAFYAMRCMDDVLTTTPERWNAAIDTIHPALQAHYRWPIEVWTQRCATWGAKTLDPIENTPLVSAIPTLLTSGYFDHVTPPQFAELAAETLSQSFVYTFPTSAHGATDDDCVAGMVQQFFDDPLTAPHTRCMAELPPLEFFVP